ncbi:hypothetical protein KA017_02140 [Candidatus Woesebacteria bacterium]|nr:hypothetical protein [Candidatus Woesebacteria bacterium]
MAIREGRWDCTYCSTTGILGRHTSCPNCSKSRSAGTKFYLSENAPVVTDSHQLQQAKAGPDWVCSSCDTSNRAGEVNCGSCGNPREGDDRKQKITDYGLGREPRGGDNYQAPEPDRKSVVSKPVGLSQSVQSYRPRISNASSFDWQSSWPWIAGIVGFLLIALLLWGIFHTRTVDLTVSGVSWERTIPVEVYRTVTEEGWSIPAGGRQQSSHQKIHHYDQVLDHYETKTRQVSEQVQTGTETYVCGSRDLGNGYFEDIECSRPVYTTQHHTETYQEPVYRDEPRYQTWYTYEIEKWVNARTEKSSGASHEVYWPEYNIGSNERVGVKTESYNVQFVDEEGETYSETLSYDEWMTFERGATYQAEVNAFGQIMEILDK